VAGGYRRWHLDEGLLDDTVTNEGWQGFYSVRRQKSNVRTFRTKAYTRPFLPLEALHPVAQLQPHLGYRLAGLAHFQPWRQVVLAGTQIAQQ
jgi:hypothetical protein